MNIQMVDVVTQYKKIKPEIDAAVLRVLESGHYIMGKEVTEFETAIAAYFGVKHAIGCASGTEALQVALMALKVGPGDEVVTTPFTFVATTETIALLGAKPVYVDIDPVTFNIDPAKIGKAITKNTKAILPVHLYGHAADMDPMMDVARKRGIPVIEDAAQSIGATYKGKKVGGIGAIGCVSFYPSKNLGAFGDAGLIITNDDGLAENIRVIANHGSRVRYKHEMLGLNSRLDAIQAAVLSVKLKYLDQWHEARRRAAQKYNTLLDSTNIVRPVEAPYAHHIYHQYTVRVQQREKVIQRLAEKNIPHGVYYPIPLHLQEAFRTSDIGEGAFPLTEKAANEVLSLPMHTELTDEQLQYVADELKKAIT